MLKIVIADDEFPSRQELRALLETNSNLEIIAECEHGEAVLDYFSNNTADAVFLDIEMPVLDGLAVGEKLKTLSNPPKIISDRAEIGINTVFPQASINSQYEPSNLKLSITFLSPILRHACRQLL